MTPIPLIVARLIVVPATLVWCKLMLDNPNQKIFRAWARAFRLI